MLIRLLPMTANPCIPCFLDTARSGEQVINLVSSHEAQDVQKPERKLGRLCTRQTLLKCDIGRNPISHCCSASIAFTASSPDYRLPRISRVYIRLEDREWLNPRRYSTIIGAHRQDCLKAWRAERHSPAVWVFDTKSPHECPMRLRVIPNQCIGMVRRVEFSAAKIGRISVGEAHQNLASVGVNRISMKPTNCDPPPIRRAMRSQARRPRSLGRL